MTATEFVSSYTAAAREQINFAWNGKHAEEFQDINQNFRWQVVEHCIAQPDTASVLLLEHLFLADAAWAEEAWSSPNHFAELGRILLERGQNTALDSFSKGFIRSFDTFGACHQIQLSKPVLEQLIAGTKKLLSEAAEENDRKRLEAVQELFSKMESQTATQGWATVAPGTPISNIRVIWPRWYHKLWAKISSLWRRRVA